MRGLFVGHTFILRRAPTRPHAHTQREGEREREREREGEREGERERSHQKQNMKTQQQQHKEEADQMNVLQKTHAVLPIKSA